MLEDRAKGGCAAVVSGEIPVNFDDSARPLADRKVVMKVDYNNFEDNNFQIFKKVAETIKKHGSIAYAELSHFGIEKPVLEDGILPLGPVAYVKEDGTQVRAFDRQTMDKVKNDYAIAANYFKTAGFQGIFLHYGHGWMPGQFLSKRSNTRTDEYGGSIENRAGFLWRSSSSTRKCGKDFLIEIRLSGEENLMRNYY